VPVTRECRDVEIEGLLEHGPTPACGDARGLVVKEDALTGTRGGEGSAEVLELDLWALAEGCEDAMSRHAVRLAAIALDELSVAIGSSIADGGGKPEMHTVST
jgi:hypothetical protein